ncbi:DNA-binding protein [Planococcus beigongshangi]|uniref:DNA-binding protein n=1 Tax=Planococcus beigongshangi TaxID=2782536 RepID=UPI00193C514F|nr:DNA-binding protein [Planococcus beigongshangi]
MDENMLVTLTVGELRNVVSEVVNKEVQKAIAEQLELQGRIEQLPPMLTREEFMKVMRVSSTTATKIFDRPDFRVFRRGKLLIETEFLFEWIRKNSDWVEENTQYFRSIS